MKHLRYVILLLSIPLAACQIGQQATPTPLPDAVALTLWHWETTEEETLAIQQQVDGFLAANPAISVTVQTVTGYADALTAAQTANTLPDIFLLDGPLANALQETGVLLPQQTTLTAPEDFHAVLRSMFGADGVLWCAPRDVSTLALVYNPDLIADAGIAAPDSSWGWAEFRAAADATTDLSQGIFGVSFPSDVTRLLPFIHMAGGSLPIEARGATSFAAPGVEEALTWFTQFGADDVSVEPIDVQSTWAGEAFAHQRAVMVIEGAWVVDWLATHFPPVLKVEGHADLEGLHVAYAELPAGATGRSTLAFGTCWGVSATSANSTAAAQLADYLTHGEAAQLWAQVAGALPARSALTESWLVENSAYQPFVAGLAYAIPWTVAEEWQPVIDSLNQGIHRLFYDETTPAEVLAEVDALYNSLLNP